MTMDITKMLQKHLEPMAKEHRKKLDGANSHCSDPSGSTSCGWTLPFGIVKVQNIPLGKLHSSGYIHGNKADCKRAEKIAKKAHLLAKEIMRHTGESVQIIIK